MGPRLDSDFDAANPGIAYDPTVDEYLVVWHGDDDAGALVNNEYEIYGQRVGSAGGELGVNDFRISDMGGTGASQFGAFDAAVAFGSDAHEYLVLWVGDDDTRELVNGEFEVFGQRLAVEQLWPPVAPNLWLKTA